MPHLSGDASLPNGSITSMILLERLSRAKLRDIEMMPILEEIVETLFIPLDQKGPDFCIPQ